MIFAQISRNIHKSCFLRKCLGIVTRKSIDFRVTIPGNKLISGYRAPEIAKKKTEFRVYLHENKNIFENILACESRDQVLLIHEKNQRSKISCYSSFNGTISQVLKTLTLRILHTKKPRLPGVPNARESLKNVHTKWF